MLSPKTIFNENHGSRGRDVANRSFVENRQEKCATPWPVQVSLPSGPRVTAFEANNK